MGTKWFFHMLCLVSSSCVQAIRADIYPTANLSSSWKITTGDLNYYPDGVGLIPVLADPGSETSPAMSCGLYSQRGLDSFVLSIYIMIGSGVNDLVSPRVLWSANKVNPVKINATLNFTSEGDLVLGDANGTLAWSTNTSGKSVIGMKIDIGGNLVLYDSSNSIVWQSFDYPTNTWLPGQHLTIGQKLVSSVSATSWSEGPFYLSLTSSGLSAFIAANPSQIYMKLIRKGYMFYPFKTGRLDYLVNSSHDIHEVVYESETEHFQYMRLESNGHLRVYHWVEATEALADDIPATRFGTCSYPLVCGSYGVCSNGKYCSCPKGKEGDSSYFDLVSLEDHSQGCVPVTPLSCQSAQRHLLLELDNVDYFEFVMVLADTNVENCKQACLNNCSCKAALFEYEFNVSHGNCALPSQIFSLTNISKQFTVHSITFIKVQEPELASSKSSPTKLNSTSKSSIEPESHSSSLKRTVIMALILAGSFVLALIAIYLTCKKHNLRDAQKEDGEEEVSLDMLPNLAKRFSYDDLKSATENFHQCRKLGGGGFGSVFKGTLGDGAKVAVKRLDLLGQGRKEFLAEVKTMGRIHHVNLVKLVGFCAERSHRLLVYEYMSNGSLDKWIFDRTPKGSLKWEIRKKIILNIAKGLTYLHEDCQKRIVHLDIKPQNILLDEDFNAKLSDFGLSKSIDKDQSHVITQMRGTRGYLAPEWLSRKITEKADVYSFGVVLLEVICGRKCMDYSQQEDNENLLQIVKKKAQGNQLFELIDKCGEDMLRHQEEVVKTMRTSLWCLHSDSARRPSMSTVVKVLEGVTTTEPSLESVTATEPIVDSSFLVSTPIDVEPNEAVSQFSTPPRASILSGPR
ncbi:G-type lectin S-receptor-like serine/threonine-protein kinase [Actinidia chinensis var. chinensis]|uniref:Receptor-like serine/threonine-protein kinase n=1 Tax=Actinidia chinensis var. chinensis TaxID=1590841 RepID=A0A2R6PUZ3_ACTCC|nr:G-type lectin S-receptor-like serine/threonine-protein kinase [Actinidia chinensis var. chinensis]